MGFNPLEPIGWVGNLVDNRTDKLGDYWNDFTGKTQQREANAANIQQADKQMQFQERMSSTAHLREVKDLEAAGINPILSARLGGASTPSGALAQVDPVPSGTRAAVDLGARAFTGGIGIGAYNRESRVANQNIIESLSRADANAASADNTRAMTELLGPKRKMAGKAVDFMNSGAAVQSKIKGVISKLMDAYGSGAKRAVKTRYGQYEKAKGYVKEKLRDYKGTEQKLWKKFHKWHGYNR